MYHTISLTMHQYHSKDTLRNEACIIQDFLSLLRQSWWSAGWPANVPCFGQSLSKLYTVNE